jgi:hypothetical protein
MGRKLNLKQRDERGKNGRFIGLPSLGRIAMVVTLLLGVGAGTAQGAYVIPARGGAQDTTAPMVHADIFYNYDLNQMIVTLNANNDPTPVLKPLTPPDEFDPSKPWAVLTGKAYNFQWAWNPGGVFALPTGAGMWIERLSQTDGLECYFGKKDMGTYAPILGTAGTSMLWQWGGMMAHNTYAVPSTQTGVVTATYRVFFGDATSGSRVGFENYDDAVVTWTWNTIPEPATVLLLTAGFLITLRRKK